METKTIRTDLLRQLAEHLLHGKLGHEKFDFSRFNDAENTCGTNGCAAGELPILWPDQWGFGPNNNIILFELQEVLESKAFVAWDMISHFFNLDEIMAWHLFSPSEWDSDA
jgi:hypothetical protein